MRSHAPTPLSTLVRAAEIAIESGLTHVYIGNLRSDWESTWCSSCGEPLITREGYRLVGWHLKEVGRCSACGVRCPGHFESQPGRWGPRSLPVDLDEVLA